MSGRLETIEIRCDAPPYAIVHVCERVGFRTPLDVRWCRMSEFLKRDDGPWARLARAWKRFLGIKQRKPGTCTCGEPLPQLERYQFWTFAGKEAEYRLGQCRRCRTMFWEEAAPERAVPRAGQGHERF